jgi:hypothetical protein
MEEGADKTRAGLVGHECPGNSIVFGLFFAPGRPGLTAYSSMGCELVILPRRNFFARRF